MAIKQPKPPEEIKALPIAKLRVAYSDLSAIFNKIMNSNYVYCPYCDEWKISTKFYSSPKTKDHLDHGACKDCYLEMATDFDSRTGRYIDNKDKTIRVFRMMDIPFNESEYEAQLAYIREHDSADTTAFQRLVKSVKVGAKNIDKTFDDSVFSKNSRYSTAETAEISEDTLMRARKRFGLHYSDEDLMFLENEYQDWISRYECNTKAQEEIFERLSLNKLCTRDAQIAGKSTKDLDKTYQDLLSSVNILPRQSSGNGLSDTLTFGQLIEKWETERPIPEPEPEFKDVDGIGKYIRIWFKGHLARALGIDNGYSKEYDDYIEQYTVRPPEYNEESTNETIYQTIFGKGTE